MFRGFRENHRFLIILLSIFLWMFTYSFQSFTKCFSYLIASLFGDGNKFNICLQMFRIRKGVYLLQSGMFRIYLKYLKYHGKMLNDIHLNVRDIIQQLQRGVLMTNIADSVSSISRCLLNNKTLPRKFQTFLPNMPFPFE